jgi:hypothetical protein
LGLDYEPVLVQQPATLDEMHDIGNGIMYGEPAPVQEPDLIARLKHPEDHYEFTDPKKSNAVLMSLCQEAADALAAPVQKPYRPLQDNGSQYFGDSWDTLPAQPAPVQPVQPVQEGSCGHESCDCRSYCKKQQKAQPAPVAFEVGLVEWVGNKLMATPKVTTTPPASWVEMVTANLVREGVNKHKARELAEHFYSLAQRQWVGLTDEEREQHRDDWRSNIHDKEFRAIEAKLRSKNNG